MTSWVSLPLWLVLIVSAFALWSVVDRLLIPALRYLMRRRFNRAIEDLNTRLKLRIQPFKLAKRQALIDQLIFDPDVLRAVDEYAAANKVTREAAQARALATPTRSCRRSRPMRISASARGSRGASPRSSIASASATWTRARCRRSIPTRR